jgi:hypothetical protein
MRSFVHGACLSILLSVGCSSSLPGNTKPGQDAALACAGSGESCLVSGCCGALSEACLPQGNDKICLNAIPPEFDGVGHGQP